MKHTSKLLILFFFLLQLCSITKAEENTPSVYQNLSTGLIGYHFNDKNLNDLVLITNHPTGDLEVSFEEIDNLITDLQKYQSAFWDGKIKISESGLYTFKTSADKYIKLWIDNQQLINENDNITPIELEANKSYEVKIEYRNKDSEPNNEHLYLYWIKPNNEEEIIPTGNFLFPDSIVSQEESLHISNRTKRNINIPLVPDSDNDGIPDSLETNGYTVDVKNGKLAVVGWNENVHRRKGLTKYYSSAMKWSTASDPYSDFQKVTGLIDKQITPEARNPLVVAYPIVNTDMEKIIVSKNNNISIGNTEDTSHTVSKSMSNSKTDSISSSINAEITASISDLGTKVATSFSKEHSSTTSVEEGTSDTYDNSWSNSIGIQTGESAYFGANVRYKNRGTAPIYKVKPTTTFVLGNNQSIATITAKENQIANVLQPGGFYPSNTQAPIMINTKDDFGSSPITLNFEQLRLLEEQKKMKIEMNQVSGGIGVLQGNGEIQVSSDWSIYLPQIENTSARIILDTKDNESIERRIAAIDPNDPLEKTKPKITLKEALKMTFGIREQNNFFYYKDRVVGGFEVICDPETFGKIQEQLDQMKEKDIYSIKLNAKMNFLIKELSIPEVMDQMFVEHKRGKGLKSNITQTTMQRMQELVTTITELDLRNQLQARIDAANVILKIRPLENVNVTRVSDNEYRVEFKTDISIPEIVGYSVLLSSGGESWAGSGENIVNIDKTITTLTPSSYINFVITLQNGKSYVLYEQKYS